MSFKKSVLIIISLIIGNHLSAQVIGEFTSLAPGNQDSYFHIPTTHSFQYIIEHGDSLTEGGILPVKNDFAGYIPINASSINGYLSINSEDTPGGVTILDIELNEFIGKWLITKSEAIDFSSVSGTARNCSGAVTPWGTIISCEEASNDDNNGDGYKDLGWSIEIDPETKQVIDQDGGLDGGDKLWALGNFKHENVVVHENRRTVYQGVDETIGYLFKFVADAPENLSAGKLYVYKGSKQGDGNWILINNSTVEDQNTTLSQCAAVEATVFNGVEDVEINPFNNMIYLAVKSESKVYRFQDSNPINGTTVTNFETYVGGTSYEIFDGDSIYNVPWGTGNDNLAFDESGNLWVMQDGSKNYIWLVGSEHTQQNPSVKIFGRSPAGSEPTGITFTPDFRYLFMSIQHPSASNESTSQPDAFGIPRTFDNHVTLVIARTENLNNNLTSINQPFKKNSRFKAYPNPVYNSLNLVLEQNFVVKELHLINAIGNIVHISYQKSGTEIEIAIDHLPNGIYFLQVLTDANTLEVKKIIISR